MKKSVASFIASNRNFVAALTIFLGLTVTGLIAWQVGATENDRKESERTKTVGVKTNNSVSNPATTEANKGTVVSRNQDAPRGMYRGNHYRGAF